MEQDTQFYKWGKRMPPKRGSWGGQAGAWDVVGEGIPALTIYGSSFGQDGDGPHSHILQVQDGRGLGSPAV